MKTRSDCTGTVILVVVRPVTLLLLCIYVVEASSAATICAFVQQSVVVHEMPPHHRSSTTSLVSSSISPTSNNGNEVAVGGGSSGTALPEVLADNRTVRCAKSSDKCYALWSEDPHNRSSIVIIAQGCWESSGKCSQSECVVEGTSSKARNNTKFCCCAGDMCNVNVRDSEPPPTVDILVISTLAPGDDLLDMKKMSFGTETVIITTTSAIAVLILAIVIVIVYRRWSNMNKPSPDSVHLMESSPPPPSPTLDLDNLKLIEMIGRGRYGCVWRGTLGNKEVAAKVFAHQHRQYYLNEKDIYNLCFMDHPSITKYIGADERPDTNSNGNTIEYYIVMAHAPYGCLQDYLRRNTIDWPTSCRMASSIAKGLAHLHTDIRKGDIVKPCISHRDVNSRNVLVKSDLSCALCDMGFAMKISGSKYYGQNGEEQHAETTSLTDVGTLRYMAPEVLEGAVNLRDCESSLKQIDVYAMGLVLWEVATRCSDLYQGTEVSEYKLPFQNEIGLHPTFEQMQVLVSRHKARPLFPEVWKDSNLAIRLLKETIEDCWDQDAEARLTSLCVEERIHELPNLWDRHKANLGVSGVSPTVNSTSIYNHNQQALSAAQQQTSLLQLSNPILTLPMMSANGGNLSDSEMTDRNANIVSVGDVLPRINSNINSGRASSCKTNDSSVSEQTAETILTLSPSSDLSLDGALNAPSPIPSPPPPLLSFTKNGSNNNNNNHKFNTHHHQQHQRSLQPHQGRNPCLERNMIMEPLEEVTVKGNRLLGKRQNDKSSVRMSRELSPERVEGLFDALNLVDTMESNALVTNDVLSQSGNRSSITTASHHPIPYLQNAVHPTLPICPKQPNVPGNGHSHYQPAPMSSTTSQQSTKLPKKGTFSGRFERTRWQSSVNPVTNGTKKIKDWTSFRTLFLDWTKPNSGNSESNSAASSSCSNHRMTNMAFKPLNSEKSNLSHVNATTSNHQQQNHLNLSHLQNPVTKVQTRVYLADPSQPTVSVVKTGLTMTCGDLSDNKTSETSPLTLTETPSSPEFGVARLHVPNGSTPIHVVQSRSRLISAATSSSYSSSLATPLDKSHRPQSLPVKGHHLSSVDDAQLLVAKSDAHTKIVQRVKTPFKLKSNRLSLCDDRMMTVTTSTGLTDSATLQRWTTHKYSNSVPGNISSACDSSSTQVCDFLTTRQSSKTDNKNVHVNRRGSTCDITQDNGLAPPLLPLPSSTTQNSLVFQHQSSDSIYHVSCI
ncbi:hypothetical protein CHUAL_010268 [Chamberlinius hualienensis]